MSQSSFFVFHQHYATGSRAPNQEPTRHEPQHATRQREPHTEHMTRRDSQDTTTRHIYRQPHAELYEVRSRVEARRRGPLCPADGRRRSARTEPQISTDDIPQSNHLSLSANPKLDRSCSTAPPNTRRRLSFDDSSIAIAGEGVTSKGLFAAIAFVALLLLLALLIIIATSIRPFSLLLLLLALVLILAAAACFHPRLAPRLCLVQSS